MLMVAGKTSSGFVFEIPEENLDNYDLLEVLAEIDSGNTGLMPKMIEMLLGKEQKDALKEHIRKQDGRVSSAKMFAVVDEIFNITKDNNEVKK